MVQRRRPLASRSTYAVNPDDGPAIEAGQVDLNDPAVNVSLRGCHSSRVDARLPTPFASLTLALRSPQL